MNEINEHSELIGGEYYISVDSLDEGPLKKAITAVTTVAVTAVTTTVRAVAGFFAGGIPGAIIRRCSWVFCWN